MKRNKRTRGFSLMELMIVLAIALVVGAMATPSVARAISNMQLRAGMSSIAGMLQRTRIVAVKTNKIAQARTPQSGAANIVFIDVNGNGIQDQAPCIDALQGSCAEPLVQFSSKITFSPGGPGIPVDPLLGFTPVQTPNPFSIHFNQRGLPCDLPAGATICDANNKGFRFYFQFNDSFGTRWAALTVTPAGRIRVWTLSGNTWS